MKITDRPLSMVYQHCQEFIFIPLKLDLPPEWQVIFEWTDDKDAYGWSEALSEDGDPFPDYKIELSKRKNKKHLDMLESMCHEMVHVHLSYTGHKDWHEHGKKFDRIINKIQKFTGFDAN